MKYPVSTSNHLTYDFDYIIPLPDQIARIISCGFKYLDFNFAEGQGDLRFGLHHGDWEKWIDEIIATADSMGARFNQAHAVCYDGMKYNGMTSADIIELQKRSVIAASRMGIPWIVYHAIFTPDKNWEKINYEAFAPIAEISEKYGVGMAFENIPQIRRDIELSRTDCLIDFADSFKSEYVAIAWDVGHGFISDGAPDIITDPYYHLEKIGARLKATHIHDNLGASDDHLAPFEGIIDWGRVMQALCDIDYKHSFTFEAHNAVRRIPASRPDLIDEKIRYLHNLGEVLVSWDNGFKM